MRSGGHSQAGHGVADDALVLDLRGLNRVVVDPSTLIVRVEGGTIVSELMTAWRPYGLVTPTGGCPDVGLGGLTLGGGENMLMARFGAVCDNVLATEVLLADGRLVAANPREHAVLLRYARPRRADRRSVAEVAAANEGECAGRSVHGRVFDGRWAERWRGCLSGGAERRGDRRARFVISERSAGCERHVERLSWRRHARADRGHGFSTAPGGASISSSALPGRTRKDGRRHENGCVPCITPCSRTPRASM